LDPQANTKTAEWFANCYLPLLMEIDDSSKYNRSKIFRELSNIHQRKKYLETLFLSQSKKIGLEKGEGELYFFDGTTSYFEGDHCTLGTPGMDKTTG
jgi:hypothetical protein